MVEPDHLVIVTGATQGLTLLVRMLAETGHTILAVESPSNASQRPVLGRHITHPRCTGRRRRARRDPSSW
jgi:DNA-binding transcriptional MocR family regulator